MKHTILLVLFISLCWGQEAQPPEQPTTPSQEPSAYQITPVDRLVIARAESDLWQARYLVETKEKELLRAVTAVRQRCETSGGVMGIPPGQNASQVQCTLQNEEARP